MNDDSLKPPHAPSSSEPLEYWHATEAPPPHQLLLGICLNLGLAVSAAIVSFAGGFAFMSSDLFENSHPSHDAPRVFKAIFVAVSVACVCGVIKSARGGRSLPINKRRTAGRFFMLGFLIGCGLACLLEGICFGAASVLKMEFNSST
jgi:hypothetical protein